MNVRQCERESIKKRERKILREREKDFERERASVCEIESKKWERLRQWERHRMGCQIIFFQNKLIQIYHDSRHRGGRDGVSKTMSYFKKKLLRAKIDLPGSEDVQKRFWILKNMPLFGCRHSSVDSSASTILLPRVRVPSTPSMLLSF